MRSGPPTVVLATTNGRGMGHLSRQLALALASLGGMNPVIFSMSAAVPVVGAFEMRAEWCPSVLRSQVPRRDWDAYLGDRIITLLDEVGASAFVFDGVFPYDGVLRALRRRPDVPFVWSRRGMWLKGVGQRALRYRKLFAAVLEPGDLASAGDVGRTAKLDDARTVMPVTLVGHVPQLPRDEARRELGLDPDRPVLLLTLGTNRRSDRYAAYGRTVERFSRAGWQVAVTSSPIADDGSLPAGTGPTVIQVFPLVRYLNAFDAAVSASGYNAVHELLYSAVPTLFVPNDAETDDQRTRARVVAEAGLAIEADPERAEFEAAMDRLLDAGLRKSLAEACRELPPTLGATDAARTVIGLAATGGQGTGQLDAAALHAQRFARRQVGRALPDGLAARLGRRTPPGSTDPRTLDVRLEPLPPGTPAWTAPPPAPPGEGELLVTDALSRGMFDAGCVEHLVAGASDEYVAARADLARRHYRLRDTRAEGDVAERWATLGWSRR